jgi:hypothetical protein
MSQNQHEDIANCVIPPICEDHDPTPTTGNNNSNSNENENSNENANQNANANCNSNTNSNEVENEITNKVNTCVNVDVKVDADISTGHSAPAIDLSNFYGYDTVVIADTGNQTLNTSNGGNIFHLDQVNNLVNNASVTDPNVTFNNGGGVDSYGQWHPGGDFHMDASAYSGSATGGGHVGDVIGAAANGIVTHADATVTQSAFDQTITTGANIQFNSLTMNVAGHDFNDSHNIGHS